MLNSWIFSDAQFQHLISYFHKLSECFQMAFTSCIRFLQDTDKGKCHHLVTSHMTSQGIAGVAGGGIRTQPHCYFLLPAWLWEFRPCYSGLQPYSPVCLRQRSFQPSVHVLEQGKEIRGKSDWFSLSIWVLVSEIWWYFRVTNLGMQ